MFGFTLYMSAKEGNDIFFKKTRVRLKSWVGTRDQIHIY